MRDLKVQCYAGYKGEEYPLRFTFGEQFLEVEEIEDQWYGPSSRYFRVRASDRNIYILRHDQDLELWSLDAFRRTLDS